MREILFRGKNEADVWHYGAYLPYESGDVAILESFSKYGYEAVELSQRCKVIPETLGQYTGLTDKNGKKIFEGDIISTDIARPYLIVEFRDGCFMFNCNDGGEDYYDIMLPILKETQTQYKYGEIIGNITDNPELLKGGAE